MATKAPPTIRTSQVRKCVPRGRQKSVGKLYSSDACESCIEAGRVGQGSSSAVRGDKKRKLEDRSTISDRLESFQEYKVNNYSSLAANPLIGSIINRCELFRIFHRIYYHKYQSRGKPDR